MLAFRLPCAANGVAMRLILISTACLLLAACSSSKPEQVDANAISAQRIAAHMAFLADDLLEGREAATRGHEIAARYMASQFQALGLEPAGEDGSFFQPVPLLQGERLAEGARFELIRNGRIESLAFESEFLPGVNYDQPDFALTAPLVFVGQGVVAPEFDHDDFAGIDVKGKIAVLLNGAPASFANDPRAFYSSGREKMAALVERGAVGAIFVSDPTREKKSPWARGAANWARPGMRLRAPDGAALDTFPQLIATASISADAASKLFTGADMQADAVFAALDAGTLRSFDLPGTVLLAGRARISSKVSRNVVARLPGSDKKLAAQHVVFSAHLDHVGIGAPINGDTIYNGALDNAMGSAVMLDAATRLATADNRPKRSIIFVAVTAEEKGLLGSEYFASHPSVAGPLVANINMDMPVLLTDLGDVTPIGIEHSTLKDAVESAASKLGITLSPDPMPEQVVFIRSDQFSFIRRGVPAIYLKGGTAPTHADVDGKALLDGFLASHYHQPSDDLSLPINYASAARLAALNAAIGRHVADADKPPRWNKNDFFGERFAEH
ncbi:MAG: aminopeptidase [Gammaproteobacteria bacterium HGW-Gammaproteobacteria-2]|jgi:Zn-dependent M28 family amino/carboxypeptidase|nr:MAG: aminopeptidase [Gammaproteobacteria bacterium HGW-Gammaproteobacteria-2]